MAIRLLLALGLLWLVFAVGYVVADGFVRDGGPVELLNVACDPTRELWRDLNEQFRRGHLEKTGQTVAIFQSHGGSASQARAVIDGVRADVVTLALDLDTAAIERAGLIDPGWRERLPNKSIPFTSTIVFVVRKGNPHGVRDWPDLLKSGIKCVVPNPKTSGNGKWAFLAMWGSVTTRGGSEAEAERFTQDVFRRVPVLDPSARGATLTFAQRRVGDVHLTWENEAHLEVAESGGDLEIVVPPVSVLAEPPVAVVSANARKNGTSELAEAYLRHLYTPQAQTVIAGHFYRPLDPSLGDFPSLVRFPVTAVARDWPDAQQRFFADGALLDRFLAPGSQ